MMRIAPLAAVLMLPTPLGAQTAAPPVFSEGEEVALAKSAAPALVSADATVLVLRKGRYAVARQGTSGVTCMVARTYPLSVEPICYDPEASRTMLPMEIRRVEMRLAGTPADEVEEAITAAIEAGELALPRRPALAYMLSAGQVLYANAETRVGAFRPHVHFYWPYATAELFGGLGTGPDAAVVISDPGQATANLIVFAPAFVDVGETPGSPGG